MIKHEDMVRKLAKDGDVIASEMTGRNAHLLHMILGIAGEAGELLDAIKKHVIYNKPLDMVNVLEEFGDLEFYMEGLRQSLNITREQCLAANIGKLAERYKKFEYSDQAAQDRSDKANEARPLYVGLQGFEEPTL